MNKQTYLDQISTLRRALSLPNLPADEAGLHRETIARIQKKIEALDSHKPPAAPPAAAQPQRRAATEPIVVYDRPAAPTPTASAATKPPASAGHRQAKPVYDPEDVPEITVEAPAMPGGARRAKVVWQDDDRTTEYLTEGEARSRFTSYLRDCADGKRAQQERWDDVKQSLCFYRLCTYYRVLSAFWGTAPTPQQLEIAPLRGSRATVFSLLI
jgi:hypothetical protein